MNAFVRSLLLVHATFLVLPAALAVIDGRLDAYKDLPQLLPLSEAILIPGTVLIVREAQRISSRRRLKLALLLWGLIPVGYVLIAAEMCLDVRADVPWFTPLTAFALFAPFMVPLVSLVWLPAVLVSAFWIERWTREASPSPTTTPPRNA